MEVGEDENGEEDSDDEEEGSGEEGATRKTARKFAANAEGKDMIKVRGEEFWRREVSLTQPKVKECLRCWCLSGRRM